MKKSNKVVVDANPTQDAQIENAQIDLSIEFLTQDLKGLTETSDVFANTANHIKTLTDKTPEMRIFLYQYKEETDRLYNNRKSIESKHKAKAKELGISVEEYEATLGETNGGKTAVRQFTDMEYRAVGFIFDPKLNIQLNKEDKLFWLEVREEKRLVDASIASKKAIAKKKLK